MRGLSAKRLCLCMCIDQAQHSEQTTVRWCTASHETTGMSVANARTGDLEAAGALAGDAP